VLLVEDDRPSREHLAAAIRASPGVSLAASAGTLAEARAALAGGPIDVLVTDLGLPDGSGIELIRELRGRAPAALALVITALGDERTVLAAIEAGASGYLLKDRSFDEVGEALAELLAGGSPITPSIARTVLRRLQREDRATETAGATPEPRPGAPRLTAREHEVLTLLAKGLSFPEAARALGVSAHTVTTHVRHIYGKLEVNSRASAVYEAVGLGLIRMED
jgi:DNA-binding NarL/FixJ family response regulator